jgi:hypothetical protein
MKIYASQNRSGAPPMTIERKQITLVCNKDGGKVGIEIWGYVCGGLALHSTIENWGVTLHNGSSITQLKDSIPIYQNIRHSHTYRIGVLRELAMLTDWHQSFDAAITDLYGNKDKLNRYRELLEKLAPGREPSGKQPGLWRKRA